MARVPESQRAVALPWLRPSATGLLALTDEPPTRAAVVDCPGTVLHVLRYSRPTPDPNHFTFSDEVLRQPGLAALAADFVEMPNAWPRDWHRTGPAQRALHFGRRAARVAADLAVKTGDCSADAAWSAALLSPLGLYVGEPGFDPTTLGRKLAVRWRLPTPFALSATHLNLDPRDVERLGGHVGLQRVVRAAVAATERIGRVQPLDAARPYSELDDIADQLAAGTGLSPAPEADPDPGPRVLAKLLRATAAARHRGAAGIVSELEARLDAAAAALADVRAGFDVALRDAKLSALAEFAAGASHEINNPLAVASGNAQLLLAGETDPDRQRRLGAVLRAVNRIHDILVGTRSFARPPAPSFAAVPVKGFLASVLESFRAPADEREVRIELVRGIDDGWAVRADREQLRQIVGNLVRNGIEAAGSGGWVRVAAESDGNRVVVAVEDSGNGPAADDVPHLFDPFFSGREAGRGRGLGLSVAWQLARQNGGSIAYVPLAGGPTRFVLTLRAADPSEVPVSPDVSGGERRSA